MTNSRAGVASLLLTPALFSHGPAPAQARKRRVLALGDTSTRTYQHVAISHALTVERLGRESGLYDTWIRTDTQWITKKRVPGYDGVSVNVRNLDDFDAFFFYSIGELPMTAEQKAESPILRPRRWQGLRRRAHWQQCLLYLARLRGNDRRPLRRPPVGTLRRAGPGRRPGVSGNEGVPARVHINDEIYQVKDYSRDNLRVLARLDASKLDLGSKRVHRPGFRRGLGQDIWKGTSLLLQFRPPPGAMGQAGCTHHVSGGAEVVDGSHRRRCHSAALAALTAIAVAGATLVAAQAGRGYPPDSSIRRASGQPPRTILALGDVSTDGYQHDSISHALSVIEELGLRAGLYETQIRTDTQLVTKGAIAAATGTLTFYRNLDDVDAVVLFVSGEPLLTQRQKEDLLSFVREGKGLVAIHSSIAAFRSWPEYARMIGGQGVETPAAPEGLNIAVTAPGVAAMSLFPASFRIRDRILPVRLAVDVASWRAPRRFR